MIGSIQVDVDGQWILHKHYGLDDSSLEDDHIFQSGLENILDLFEKNNIKATFFVIGKDLEIGWKADLIRKAKQSGHEIANHSWDHPTGFSFLSQDKQSEQISKAGNIIELVCGEKPLGFRAPDFDFDSSVLQSLMENNYLYDSSILPCLFSPLLRTVKRFLAPMNRNKTRYLGSAINYFSPKYPYKPDKCQIWKQNKDTDIWEVPVCAFPFLGIPFHASFMLALGSFGVKYALSALSIIRKLNQPLVYLFHIADLATCNDGRLKVHKGLFLPINNRIVDCQNILDYIVANWQIKVTRDIF